MSKITIEDISRHTGLSRGTVSRALNNRPDISVQTKQRVLDACRQLNYVPSHAARSLATGRCFAVGVVVDDLRSGYAASFLRGVVARAAVERYAVHVTETGVDPAAAVEHLCAVANERVDSLLLASPLRADLSRRLWETLDDRPLVAAETIEGFACDVFAPDEVEAGRLVGRHLLRGSAADVLYVHQPGPANDQRLTGFQETCRERGIHPEEVTLTVRDGGNEALGAVHARLPNVRAVAASDDFLAIDLMLLCRGMHRTPGQDVAVMGQGNEWVGARVNPSLSTIDFCGEEIGRRALELAIQRITKTRQDAPQRTCVAPVLVTRESTRIA